MAVGELKLIEYIRGLAAEGAAPWLEVGIGDDCAVARLPGGERIAVTTDMLIEGTHFGPDASPEQIGHKAVARCLSDLAAMAARPLCVVAAVSFAPATQPEFARRVSRALWETADRFEAPLVGGDVAEAAGPLSLTVTALGLAGPAGFVTRAGALPGDRICVTGALGGSLRGRHLSFQPRVPEALDLAKRLDLHAMIDVSDGLSTDVLHLARAGGVGVTLEADAIPVHADAEASAGAEPAPDGPVRHALNDGEDYELVFCVSESHAQRAADEGVLGTPVSIVGRVTRQIHCRIVWRDGTRESLRGHGWEHMAT